MTGPTNGWVDTAGLKREEVLIALYEAATTAPFAQKVLSQQPLGWDDAQRVLSYQSSVTYLRGRTIKVEFAPEGFDPAAYDAANGKGAAQRAIDQAQRQKSGQALAVPVLGSTTTVTLDDWNLLESPQANRVIMTCMVTGADGGSHQIGLGRAGRFASFWFDTSNCRKMPDAFWQAAGRAINTAESRRLLDEFSRGGPSPGKLTGSFTIVRIEPEIPTGNRRRAGITMKSMRCDALLEIMDPDVDRPRSDNDSELLYFWASHHEDLLVWLQTSIPEFGGLQPLAYFYHADGPQRDALLRHVLGTVLERPDGIIGFRNLEWWQI